MDELSKKNEAFVNDSVLMLSLINDIKMYEKNLEYLIKEYENGTAPDSSVIFTEYQKIYDAKIKLDDIVSSINMHGWKISYEQEDLNDIIMSTTKNCVITDVTIPKTIHLTDIIPAFTLKITNLSLDAITVGDEIIITLSNSSIGQQTSVTIPISNSIPNIMNEDIIMVEGLPCPSIPYEYDLDIKIRHIITDFVFGEYHQKGVNIIENTDGAGGVL